MSALAWLFGLGALTIAFPFLLHLIRRTPKGKTEFSSLMFLRPSPPRLTRRSRLENWLLLLLRCGAILLVALAFMRPFFRNGTQIPVAEIPGRNIAVLIDNSASMRRGNLMSDAKKQAKDLIKDLAKQDRVGLYSFSHRLNQLVDIADDADAESSHRRASDALDNIDPTWHRSNLGEAIASIAETLSEKNDSDQAQTPAQIYVVTDFQKSSKLESLQSIQWPANVKLKVIPIESDQSNASIQILDNDEEEEGEPEDATVRVRIRNSAESSVDQFRIQWAGSKATDELAQYVPPGSSRVVSVTPPEDSTVSQVLLHGDPCDYDNQFHFVGERQRTHLIAYLGNESSENPDSLRYYFERALVDTPTRQLEVRSQSEMETEKPTLMLVTDVVSDSRSDQIDAFLDEGGTVVLVGFDNARIESYSKWIGGSVDQSSVQHREYSLLADIDFQHSIFSTFDNPRYNDFTKIKFWQHTRVQLDDPDQVNVIARFDDDAPAIWIRRSGKGRVIGLAFGWQTEQSQLALSNKFLPIVNQIVELAIDNPDPVRGCIVGETVSLSVESDSLDVTTPSGESIPLEPGQTTFDGTDVPGIYSVKSNGQLVQQFAANVDPAESDLSTMSVEQLEALGVATGEQATAEERAEQLRTLQDTQLESQQKIWKWAICATLLLLLIESFLGFRKSTVASSSLAATDPVTAQVSQA